MAQNVQIKQAVILAGGLGERLRPITDKVPKPMAPVGGRPFLDYLLESIRAVGVRRVLLLVGYKSEVIKNYYGIGRGGLEISYNFGAVEDQTCKRVLDAQSKLEDNFLLTYGDNYWPIEFQKMVKFFNEKGRTSTTTVFKNTRGTAEYGFENNVMVDGQGLIQMYDKSRKNKGLNGVDMGYFLLNRSVFDRPFSENPTLDGDLIPALVTEKKLYGYLTEEQYYFMTKLETLKAFENVVLEKRISPL